MQTFDFLYSAIIKVFDGDFIVISYNSPYNPGQDFQSIDDIIYAIKEQKILDIKELENDRYSINILCKFIKNEDGSFNQIFNLNNFNKV